MRSSGMIVAAVVLLLSAAAGAADCPCTEGLSRQSAESPEGKADRLNRIIADQDTFIELLMENLANCAEENESMAEGRGKEPGDKGFVSGEKMRLMGRLQAALHTEEHLGFLNGLSEAQLARLLELVEGISKGDMPGGGDGGPETQTEGRRPETDRGPGPGTN